jgi:hypothetical protein
VIINITLERQTEDYLDRFEAAVRKHPEIRECYLMTGGSDYLLRVDVENAGAFERIHKEVLSTLRGVLRIHSSFSIRDVLAAPTVASIIAAMVTPRFNEDELNSGRTATAAAGRPERNPV